MIKEFLDAAEAAARAPTLPQCEWAKRVRHAVSARCSSRLADGGTRAALYEPFVCTAQSTELHSRSARFSGHWHNMSFRSWLRTVEASLWQLLNSYLRRNTKTIKQKALNQKFKNTVSTCEYQDITLIQHRPLSTEELVDDL